MANSSTNLPTTNPHLISKVFAENGYEFFARDDSMTYHCRKGDIAITFPKQIVKITETTYEGIFSVSDIDREEFLSRLKHLQDEEDQK